MANKDKFVFQLFKNPTDGGSQDRKDEEGMWLI